MIHGRNLDAGTIQSIVSSQKMRMWIPRVGACPSPAYATIFDMIWFGEGRWDWDTIYNMPVFLRNFWIKKINNIVQQREQQTKQQAATKKPKR
jgi:hypothetical protein